MNAMFLSWSWGDEGWMMGVRGQIDTHICHCTASAEKQNSSPSNVSVCLPSGMPHVPAGTPHGKCHVYHQAEEKHMSGPDARE